MTNRRSKSSKRNNRNTGSRNCSRNGTGRCSGGLLVLTIGLLIMLGGLLAACGDQEASEDPQGAAGTCEVTVEGYCEDQAVEFAEGDSVYDALKKTGVEVSAQKNSDGSLYIEGINGKFASDDGEPGGWVYEVNDEQVMESCDQLPVRDGDEIDWYYMIFSDDAMMEDSAD